MKRAMASIMLMTTLLTGCTSLYLFDKSEKSLDERWVKTDFSDTIIAIGEPKTPIKGYENALVLAGEKHAYLVQASSSEDDLKKIFKQIDLRYLTIALNNKDGLLVRQQGDWVKCDGNLGCADVELVYNKPRGSFTEQEEKILAELGFHYWQSFRANTPSITNKHIRKISFTVTEPVTNKEQLQHQFKQPVKLNYAQFNPNKGKITRGMTYGLIPIAIAFDIVTFPLQMIYCHDFAKPEQCD